MSFIPGTQTMKDIEPVNLGNPQDLFQIAPQVKGVKPISCPLKAGSCTFHNGLAFHYAGPNRTDSMREAMAVLYMPDGTCMNGNGHCVIEKNEFAVGQRLTGPKFPIVSTIPLPELELEEAAALVKGTVPSPAGGPPRSVARGGSLATRSYRTESRRPKNPTRSPDALIKKLRNRHSKPR